MRSSCKKVSCLALRRRHFSTKTFDQLKVLSNEVETNFLSTSLLRNPRRQYSSRGRFGGKALHVAIVPLSALLFITWAFVYGGLTLKRPPQYPPQIIEVGDEPAYSSKVERLHNERRARKYAEMQKLSPEEE